MSRQRYDPRTDTYIVEISKDELHNAFKSRRAYIDFLFENFGFHLTDVDWKDLDEWAKEDKE